VTWALAILVVLLLAALAWMWWRQRPQSPVGAVLRKVADGIDEERAELARQASAELRAADVEAAQARRAADIAAVDAGDAKRQEADEWARKNRR